MSFVAPGVCRMNQREIIAVIEEDGKRFVNLDRSQHEDLIILVEWC